MRKYGLEAYHPEFFHYTTLCRDICRVNYCDKPNASFRNHNAENDWPIGILLSIQPVAEGEGILIVRRWSRNVLTTRRFSRCMGLFEPVVFASFPRIAPGSRVTIPTKLLNQVRLPTTSLVLSLSLLDQVRLSDLTVSLTSLLSIKELCSFCFLLIL